MGITMKRRFSAALIMIGVSSFCAACAFGSSNGRLTALEREIKNDIRPGQTVESASNVLIGKYHASSVDLRYPEGVCDRSFNINDKIDNHGVYYTLMIRLYCTGGKVSRVSTAIVGNGP